MPTASRWGIFPTPPRRSGRLAGSPQKIFFPMSACRTLSRMRSNPTAKQLRRKMKAHFHRLISFTALGMAPLWIPLKLIRYRGHFLDGVSRSLAILLREVPLRFAAQRAGIRLENPFLRFPGIEREPTRLVPGHWTSSHEQIEYPLLIALCA